jgi:hypothetical protein
VTVTSNVPPPPRLTGEANVDLAAIVAWAYAMYRVLATDDGGLTGTLGTLRTDLDELNITVGIIGTGLSNLQTSTATDIQALSDAQDILADAIDALTLRLDAIASITPVPGVFVSNDLRLAINAIITAAA